MKFVLCIQPIQVHTHLEQWAANAAAPREQLGGGGGVFGALLLSVTIMTVSVFNFFLSIYFSF